MATTSPSERLVIAGPSSLLHPSPSTSSPKQFLLLPHPRTALPAYFLPSAASSSSTPSSAEPTAEEYDEIYELQSSKSDRKARSWFLGGSKGEGDEEGESAETRGLAGEKGWVIQDFSLHLLSRIDSAFLLLPMLDVLLPPPTPKSTTEPAPTSAPATLLVDSGSYLPAEDLFESVAGTMHRRLLQARSKLAGKGAAAAPTGVDEEGSWADIPSFGQLSLARKALEKLCSIQKAGEVGTDGKGEQYFRPSPQRIVSFLQRKVLALSTPEVFHSHPATLGRMLDRAVDDPLVAIARANGTLNAQGVSGGGAGAAEGNEKGDLKTRKVRTELALDLVRGYVPTGGRVEELFEVVVKGGLMKELDGEDHGGRDDREAYQVREDEEDADADAEDALREQEAGL
ncbi:hypothetical protein BCV69DRAFT_283682 [Microstroma glucosiphilum]|uniref:Rnh202 triple barrel domain-containing protein n=1 Tax=Pseudomicrostroma glucosiphilum TaxID=1684307 RepID=A0A316UAT1_9BASI|nr:hypothetical protein BCV69DRAFT_283682 [Pseudomicrostroma glucosiphilum]PWN20145.1 hypothetical protein BCV69DRAFT_283682 [Pseudomicrostroma glucosiphilum]